MVDFMVESVHRPHRELVLHVRPHHTECGDAAVLHRIKGHHSFGNVHPHAVLSAHPVTPYEYNDQRLLPTAEDEILPRCAVFGEQVLRRSFVDIRRGNRHTSHNVRCGRAVGQSHVDAVHRMLRTLPCPLHHHTFEEATNSFGERCSREFTVACGGYHSGALFRRLHPSLPSGKVGLETERICFFLQRDDELDTPWLALPLVHWWKSEERV